MYVCMYVCNKLGSLQDSHRFASSFASRFASRLASHRFKFRFKVRSWSGRIRSSFSEPCQCYVWGSPLRHNFAGYVTRCSKRPPSEEGLLITSCWGRNEILSRSSRLSRSSDCQDCSLVENPRGSRLVDVVKGWSLHIHRQVTCFSS